MSSFMETHAFGKPLCRLGLGYSRPSTLTTDDVLHAVDRGVNFLNWPGPDEGPPDPDPFSDAIASLGDRRDSVAICIQFWARSAADAAPLLRETLKSLRTDHIDVLTLYYVESPEEWAELSAATGALPYLKDAQRDGVVRHIGVTSHQRKLAAAMAQSGLLDCLMIRYNAAHRGAERDIFPVTTPLDVPVIAYTALRWGALLRTTPDDPPAFTPPVPSECYHFVLQNPAVALTLAGPKNRRDLDEDLETLTATAPLDPVRYAALAAHGDRVKTHAGSFP